jgi:acyl carrier protein
MPLSAHGKVDVAALPAMDPSRPQWLGAFVAPRTNLEQLIAQQWAAALAVPAVGIHDNFFESGGHSLLATELVWQLEEWFPTETPLLNLFFQTPTVVGLAEAIARECPADLDLQQLAATVKLAARETPQPTQTPQTAS